MRKRHGGQHLVSAAGQALQHALAIAPIRGLAENLAVEHHGGVGRQHRRLGRLPRLRSQPGIGLGGRQSRDVGSEALARQTPSRPPSAPTTRNGTPICSSNSRRRGEPEAR